MKRYQSIQNTRNVTQVNEDTKNTTEPMTFAIYIHELSKSLTQCDLNQSLTPWRSRGTGGIYGVFME